MDNSINNKRSKSAINVMKTLSLFTMEDMKSAHPLKVTFISNKKAKIVKAKAVSEMSTESSE
jgi:hypothetical protein